MSMGRALAFAVALAAAGMASVAAAARPALPASAPVQKPSAAAAQTVSHGLFTGVQVFRPAGEVKQFVLLLTDEAGPDATERQLAQSMTKAGALVAAVPLAPFHRRLEAQGGSCLYAAGAFENLAHQVQAIEKLPTYLEPMLVGAGASRAAFAYGVMAQAPAGSFVSALSLGFCPRLDDRTPLCATNALRWQAVAGGRGVELQPATQAIAPWAAVQSGNETAACGASAAQAFVARVPQASWVPLPSGAPAATAGREGTAGFDAAYARLATHRVSLGAPPAQLADLPIVEVPATAAAGGDAGNARRFAVLLSGDGGWAGIDKSIAAALAKQGVPVAGFDSLRYFWSARTPEGLAADLDRLIRYYAARWQRSEVLLIGYSQGADVLPFAINRLPARTRASVQLTALLGLGQKAAFEFHVTHWIGASGDRPIAPEAQKLSAAGTLCIHGSDERDSLCPQLAPKHVRALALPGGHHFGGDYDALAGRILEAVPSAAPPPPR
ncbi:virulence factor family protein [Methylibium sp. Pch-M]|uniref:virulence factor family protein n=1 Tax=Methylibium sp. Pch-M TaxID=2082386 RepID=UPI001012D03B|nr:AcvB/VirJ family lysyl-phosphatidylglycerol hydrolase [Methylibium sp. Pch-M]